MTTEGSRIAVSRNWINIVSIKMFYNLPSTLILHSPETRKYIFRRRKMGAAKLLLLCRIYFQEYEVVGLELVYMEFRQS